jgi:putative Mn2+ efflux pump MntP
VLVLSALLIAAVSNLDNLAVAVAFGMRDRAISMIPNLIVAAATMVGTASAITLGHALSRLMPPATASLLGSSVIIGIGAATILAALRTIRDPDSPLRAEPTRGINPENPISRREALALAVALSLNNVGSGVGAGVAGIPPLTTTLLAGALSLLCIAGGSHAGTSARRLLAAGHALLLAGLILLAVGGATLAGAN